MAGSGARSRKVGGARLSRMRDEDLLGLRFRDLGVRLEGTDVGRRVRRLMGELGDKGLAFRPYVWVSVEWMTPVGLTGFGVPFYLCHPRLTRLERTMMFEAEGSGERECMKILRHETGHAIQYAYRLNRRKRWRELFGSSGQAYPETYQPKPYSKKYVQHIHDWYAQSHPDEDFAETFAVWLTPKSGWKRRYAGWAALKKLEYVDELMSEIAGKKPLVSTRERQDSIATIGATLGEHYGSRQDQYALEHPAFHDQHLRKLFPEEMATGRTKGAGAFLRAHRRELRRLVSYWTGQYQYMIDQVLWEMIERCEALGLRASVEEEERLTREAAIMLTVQTMNYLHSGMHRVSM
ncbi:MAG: putative zinc-binding metallopeptidase [Phycisphaerales bacterium]